MARRWYCIVATFLFISLFLACDSSSWRLNVSRLLPPGTGVNRTNKQSSRYAPMLDWPMLAPDDATFQHNLRVGTGGLDSLEGAGAYNHLARWISENPVEGVGGETVGRIFAAPTLGSVIISDQTAPHGDRVHFVDEFDKLVVLDAETGGLIDAWDLTETQSDPNMSTVTLATISVAQNGPNGEPTTSSWPSIFVMDTAGRLNCINFGGETAHEMDFQFVIPDDVQSQLDSFNFHWEPWDYPTTGITAADNISSSRWLYFGGHNKSGIDYLYGLHLSVNIINGTASITIQSDSWIRPLDFAVDAYHFTSLASTPVIARVVIDQHVDPDRVCVVVADYDAIGGPKAVLAGFNRFTGNDATLVHHQANPAQVLTFPWYPEPGTDSRFTQQSPVIWGPPPAPGALRTLWLTAPGSEGPGTPIVPVIYGINTNTMTCNPSWAISAGARTYSMVVGDTYYWTGSPPHPSEQVMAVVESNLAGTQWRVRAYELVAGINHPFVTLVFTSAWYNGLPLAQPFLCADGGIVGIVASNKLFLMDFQDEGNSIVPYYNTGLERMWESSTSLGLPTSSSPTFATNQDPGQRDIFVAAGDGRVYQFSALGVTISGYIKEETPTGFKPLPGAVVTYNDGHDDFSGMTDDFGLYKIFHAPNNSSGSLTADCAGFDFAPKPVTINLANSDLWDQDFIAFRTGYPAVKRTWPMWGNTANNDRWATSEFPQGDAGSGPHPASAGDVVYGSCVFPGTMQSPGGESGNYPIGGPATLSINPQATEFTDYDKIYQCSLLDGPNLEDHISLNEFFGSQDGATIQVTPIRQVTDGGSMPHSGGFNINEDASPVIGLNPIFSDPEHPFACSDIHLLAGGVLFRERITMFGDRITWYDDGCFDYGATVGGSWHTSSPCALLLGTQLDTAKVYMATTHTNPHEMQAYSLDDVINQGTGITNLGSAVPSVSVAGAAAISHDLNHLVIYAIDESDQAYVYSLNLTSYPCTWHSVALGIADEALLSGDVVCLEDGQYFACTKTHVYFLSETSLGLTIEAQAALLTDPGAEVSAAPFRVDEGGMLPAWVGVPIDRNPGGAGGSVIGYYYHEPGSGGSVLVSMQGAYNGRILGTPAVDAEGWLYFVTSDDKLYMTHQSGSMVYRVVSVNLDDSQINPDGLTFSKHIAIGGNGLIYIAAGPANPNSPGVLTMYAFGDNLP